VVEDEIPLITRQLRGNVFVRINHTDRTWGTDIDALLTGQIKTFFRRESTLRELIRLHSTKLGFASAIAIALLTMFTINQSIGQLVDPRITEAKKLVTNSTNLGLDRYMRMILDILIDDPKGKYFGDIVLASVMSLIVAMGIGIAVLAFSRAHLVLVLYY
jgi:hypothetical protein